MPFKALAPELVPLVHHIELAKAGWSLRLTEQLATAAACSSGQTTSAADLRFSIEKQYGVHTTEADVRRAAASTPGLSWASARARRARIRSAPHSCAPRCAGRRNGRGGRGDRVETTRGPTPGQSEPTWPRRRHPPCRAAEEPRWARDRIPSDRTRRDSLVPPARAAVDGAGVADRDFVERRVVTAGPAASQRVHRRTSAQPEMSVPNVCSVQLPNVCSFRLPVTHPRYRLHDLPVLPRTLPLLAVT